MIDFIKAIRELSAWVWGCLVGFAGMVGTAVALWTANVASPKDLQAAEHRIMNKIKEEVRVKDEELKNINSNITRIDENVSWLVRNRGGTPKE